MKTWLILLALLGVFLLVGCINGGGEGSANDTGTGNGGTGLPNPAAVYCGDQGGTYEVRTNPDQTTYSVCVLPSGAECEAWAYHRGECTPQIPLFTEGTFSLGVLDCYGDDLRIINNGTGSVLLNSTTKIQKRGSLTTYGTVSGTQLIQPMETKIIPLTIDLYTLKDVQNVSITRFSLQTEVIKPDGFGAKLITNFECDH